MLGMENAHANIAGYQVGEPKSPDSERKSLNWTK
jgi:hypothetical protein